MGPPNSGKSTWFSTVQGIILTPHIASVTKEGKFATHMLNNDTQVVLMEEWEKGIYCSQIFLLAMTCMETFFHTLHARHNNTVALRAYGNTISRAYFFHTASIAYSTNIVHNVVFTLFFCKGRHGTKGMYRCHHK